MKVLALEPWYGGSHKHFLKDLARHSLHDVKKVTMTARFWKWRMQGGAVTLAQKAVEQFDQGFSPDVLFVTDMVNLPAFLSLTRPHFSDIPVVLYFHENQLTYPIREDKERDYTYAYINYLSALSADRVVFNSRFHLDQFFEDLPGLLRRFPDYTHLGTLRDLRAKSSVLHLGLDLEGHDAHGPAAEAQRSSVKGPPVVLWNQRWEYDKNPEAFFRVMNRLEDAGIPFRMILAGEHFEEQPEGFKKAFERYAERILHYGYAENFAEYSSLLHRADIVVSTARHEFFGIAMLEAIYCGCHPLLPNRLTYPELIPENLHCPLLHAPILYEEEEELFGILKRLLTGEDQRLPKNVLQDIPTHLSWKEHVSRFDELLESVVD